MLKHSEYKLRCKIEIWIPETSLIPQHYYEWKELNRSKSGVYLITNKVNGNQYIGQSRDLETRWKHHCTDLMKGTHKSSLMQQDFELTMVHADILENKINCIFEFTVLAYCRPSELTFIENIMINALHPVYNTKVKK